LERKVHGTIIKSAKLDTGKQSRLDELREELVVARQKLVAAVSKRSRDEVLGPLRNEVGLLLEKIEKLCSAERFRR
jgi:hypothetical protein